MRTADRGIRLLMSIEKEPGDRIARVGGRAAAGKDPGADRLRFSETVASLTARVALTMGSGLEFEVQFSAFKGRILRYIWTFGQIFSTVFMNRSR